MFGGENNTGTLTGYLADNQLQFNSNTLPQLQLFGDVVCGVRPSNFTGNQHATSVEQAIIGSREVESISRQKKLHKSLNDKLYQDEGALHCSIMKPNPVSTGLRLSYEDDEHNSSITSVCEHVGAIPHVLSLGDNLKVEIDHQKEEFHRYIRLQEENMIKGLRELKQRHTYSFLSAIGKGVGRRLHEKEQEIENMNSKNKELVENIKQVSMEVQSWHYKAKYNESVVHALKNNLKQAMAQSAMHVKEGYGDSEEDDAASRTNNLNHLNVVDGSGNSTAMKKLINCRVCNVQEVSILLLPCRHLCLCKDCEGFIGICPICKAIKTVSVQVYLS